MASAYNGTIKDLRSLSENGKLISELVRVYEQNFQGASESLIRSWENSIPPLLNVLHPDKFDSTGIILEYRMPIGDERADAILLSKNENGLFGIVVEMKQWSTFNETASKIILQVPGVGKQEHPSAQALNYEGKLKNLHSIGERYKWRSACFMHNLEPHYKNILSNNIDELLSKRAPVFGREDMEQFSKYCEDHLSNSIIDIADISTFDDAVYKQTKGFFNIIRNNGKDIANNVTSAIADTGAGLTTEQEILAEEILESTRQGEDKVYIVQGSPGSGKSLVAVHLLLKSLANELSALLVLRNNRLMAIIRECLNKSFPGASGATIYSSVPRYQSGLGDINNRRNYQDLRLAICDESQRFNRENLKVIMERANTVVFFYDEEQILNPGEEGTEVNFISDAEDIGKSIEICSLTSFMRCRGGEAYHQLVDKLLLLHDKTTIHTEDLRWRQVYDFEVMDSIDEMIEYLKGKRERHKVALIASFTESKGIRNNTFHPENIRIGPNLSSGFELYRNIDYEIPWLMDPKNDYTPFWLEGRSNELNMVSSIYGCQGFESDYIGVIWGRDFVRRGDRWEIGDSNIITDNIDGLATCVRNDSDKAIKLLRNRYRIFLTRGMLGTIIFCEDEETGNYLKGIFTDEDIKPEWDNSSIDPDWNEDSLGWDW